MEILVGLIVVLAVAAFFGRGSGAAPHVADASVAPRLVQPETARERADDAFITGYLIGRHAETASRTDTASPWSEDDSADAGWRDDCADDWDDC